MFSKKTFGSVLSVGALAIVFGFGVVHPVTIAQEQNVPIESPAETPLPK